MHTPSYLAQVLTPEEKQLLSRDSTRLSLKDSEEWASYIARSRLGVALKEVKTGNPEALYRNILMICKQAIESMVVETRDRLELQDPITLLYRDALHELISVSADDPRRIEKFFMLLEDRKLIRRSKEYWWFALPYDAEFAPSIRLANRVNGVREAAFITRISSCTTLKALYEVAQAFVRDGLVKFSRSNGPSDQDERESLEKYPLLFNPHQDATVGKIPFNLSRHFNARREMLLNPEEENDLLWPI